MSDYEELKKLEDIAWEIGSLKAEREDRVVVALLAGHSQREVATAAGVAVNTVRAIMVRRSIVHSGEQYSVKEPA